jgi:hypothetical protein
METIINENLNIKIENFTQNSNKSNTIILTDFDYTISKRFNLDSNEQLYSTYDFINYSTLGEKIKLNERNTELRKYYLPIETDTSIELNQRILITKEWFIKALNLYMECKFTYKDLENMIEEGLNKKNKFCFKDFFIEYFNKLIELDFPIIIVSGGIKEIIDILLKKYIKNYEELKKNNKIIILSNNFNYNNLTDEVESFDLENLIFTFNKSISVKNLIENKFKNIKYIITLGDHLNDIDMVNDLNISNENILYIGFINVKNNISEEEKNNMINLYKKVYDINILNDSYLYIIELLKKIYN